MTEEEFDRKNRNIQALYAEERVLIQRLAAQLRMDGFSHVVQMAVLQKGNSLAWDCLERALAAHYARWNRQVRDNKERADDTA